MRCIADGLRFCAPLPEADLARAFTHPQWGRVPIDESIAMYAWHCRHHAAHIEQALSLKSEAESLKSREAYIVS